ncbi:MAG: hypothetical protein ABFD69_09380 [Candidatus Sumerlaeia bacterium]
MRIASIFLTCCAAWLAAAGARADVIVLKNGTRIETEKAFSMAGACYYKRDGAMTSIAETEVEKIIKGDEAQAAPAAPPTAAPAAAPAEEQGAGDEDMAFIRECRLAIVAEAEKTGSDYKATCAKALRMVERMYDGNDPGDGSFGYYLDYLNNPMTWEILPQEQSARLKSMIFQKDGVFDQYYQPYKERMKALKMSQTFALADAAMAHEKAVREQEDAYKQSHSSRTRWAVEAQRRRESSLPVAYRGGGGARKAASVSSGGSSRPSGSKPARTSRSGGGNKAKKSKSGCAGST